GRWRRRHRRLPGRWYLCLATLLLLRYLFLFCSLREAFCFLFQLLRFPLFNLLKSRTFCRHPGFFRQPGLFCCFPFFCCSLFSHLLLPQGFGLHPYLRFFRLLLLGGLPRCLRLAFSFFFPLLCFLLFGLFRCSPLFCCSLFSHLLLPQGFGLHPCLRFFRLSLFGGLPRCLRLAFSFFLPLLRF